MQIVDVLSSIARNSSTEKERLLVKLMSAVVTKQTSQILREDPESEGEDVALDALLEAGDGSGSSPVEGK